MPTNSIDVGSDQPNSYWDEQQTLFADGQAPTPPSTHGAAYVAVNNEVLSALDGRVGAVLDGVTDNAAAFDRATALLANGGEFYIPPGVLAAKIHTSPTDSAHSTAFAIPSGVKVRGSGANNTRIMLLAGSPAGDAFINAHPTAGTDTDITVEDLTLDGNGANQTGTNYHNGVAFYRGRLYRFTRVVSKNFYGNGNAGAPAESGQFVASLCADITYTDCYAIGDSGSTASGFMSNAATNVRRHGCTAHGMGFSMGFTDYKSALVSNVGCTAYLNHLHGFNAEACDQISYSACLSGGQASAFADGFPFSASQALGNSGTGFTMNGSTRFSLTGCQSRFNGGTGLALANAYTALSGTVDGGSYSDNTSVGINAALLIPNVNIGPTVECLRNTGGNLSLQPPMGVTALHGVQNPAPAIPASGTVVTNPFPSHCTVVIVGGTGTQVEIFDPGGFDYPFLAGTFRLSAGGTIKLTYTVAPTAWYWWTD